MSDSFRCVVGVPSGANWNAQFGVDLVNLVSAFTMHKVPGYSKQSLQVVNVRSSILSKNRLDIVKEALKLRATHLLFLDSDQTFPKNLAHRLAAHRKLIVAANIATKVIPAQPTARAKGASGTGTPVYTDQESAGLEQVWRVGTGVMLINMQVFYKVRGDLWAMKYLPECDTYQGEDWTFCACCEEAGIPIFIDHDVSKEIGHVGNYEFTHAVVGQLVDEAQKAEEI